MDVDDDAASAESRAGSGSVPANLHFTKKTEEKGKVSKDAETVRHSFPFIPCRCNIHSSD